ncbi:MAG: hypothetical protein Q4B43_05900 [Bacteroidota bacterium]|nr:hypothetical protein [Bacteroidota bacterium]
MSKTIFQTQLSGLSDDFFVESLQYEDVAVLEQLLTAPPPKIEGYQVRLRHYTISQTDEDLEQIMAHAPKSAIQEALKRKREFSRRLDESPEPVYDKNGNIVDYL